MKERQESKILDIQIFNHTCVIFQYNQLQFLIVKSKNSKIM